MAESTFIFSSETVGLPELSFSDFLHIFLLGDTVRLLSMTPRGLSNLAGQDPLKSTLLLQSLRRLPLLTAIPLTVTIMLLVVTIIKVWAPLLQPLLQDPHQEEELHQDTMGDIYQHLVDKLKHQQPKELLRQLLQVDYEDVSINGFKAKDNISKKVGGAKDEGEGVFVKRRGKRNAESGSNQKVGKDVASGKKDALDSLLSLLPSVGGCVGALVGCHARLTFLDTTCLPFSILGSCTKLLGVSLKGVLGKLGEEAE